MKSSLFTIFLLLVSSCSLRLSLPQVLSVSEEQETQITKAEISESLIQQRDHTYIESDMKTIIDEFVNKNGIATTVESHDCIYSTLRSILPQCLTPSPEGSYKDTEVLGITEAERIGYSIGLSICQFEASYMDFPKECLSLSHHKQCLVSLQKSPQMWTTFNGYYQRLGKLCSEQGAQFQREKILSLYKMMATNQNNIVMEMAKVSKKIARQQSEGAQEVFQTLEKLKDELPSLMVQIVEKESIKLMAQYSRKIFEANQEFSQQLGSDLDSILNTFENNLRVNAESIFTNIRASTHDLTLQVNSLNEDLIALRDHTEDAIQAHDVLSTEIERSIELVDGRLVPHLANLTAHLQTLTNQVPILGYSNFPGLSSRMVLRTLCVFLWLFMSAGEAGTLGSYYRLARAFLVVMCLETMWNLLFPTLFALGCSSLVISISLIAIFFFLIRFTGTYTYCINKAFCTDVQQEHQIHEETLCRMYRHML